MSELYDWQAEGDFAQANSTEISRSIKFAAATGGTEVSLLELNQAINNTHLPLAINLLSGLATAAITYIVLERNSQPATSPQVQT